MRHLPSAVLLALLVPAAPVPAASAQGIAPVAEVADSLRGRSGRLQARLVGGSRGGSIRVIETLFGDSAARSPGLPEASASSTGPFAFINMLPFGAKQSGRIGSYRIGTWPGERRARAGGAGTVPDGFIEVTPDNQETSVSEHFRLKDFLTHDQPAVWPKYLVLREALVDKLELIIADLRSRGHSAARLVVLSGFRTPLYNRRGAGGARDSRHQYGDAADIFVDADGNGRMDDLNRDGRVDARDARVLMESVDRVEREHPAMLGGASAYRATRAHGPFVHVDVRGKRVRWGGD